MRASLVIVCASVMGTCAQPPTLLEEVEALGELRVVTRNSPTTYYTGANGPEGPEYDLVKGFADFLGVELKLESADRFMSLIPAVESGKFHVAAAGMTVTPERAKRVNFGPTYQKVEQYLVYKLGTGKPRNLDALIGKKLEVMPGTSYVKSLKNMQAKEPALVWTENPNTDIAELLLSVTSEKIDYTIADSTLFNVYRNFVPEIRIGFELSVADSLAWAFPKRHDDSLIKRADEYLQFIRDKGDLDQIMDRYYGHTDAFDYVGTRRFIRDYTRKLPKYREMFEDTAEALDMDWRLLAAIGYQESQWDPLAVSPTGVRGIMMLTENTATVMGIADRVDAAQSIVGGAQYLARMKRRFPGAINEPDRTWFALAAYNIGYGHVQDARQITRDLGDDPDLWVHVEKNLPLLAQRSWYSKTPHGYARGWEPVAYVENIRNYYDVLLWITNEGADEPLPENLDPPPTVAHAQEETIEAI